MHLKKERIYFISYYSDITYNNEKSNASFNLNSCLLQIYMHEILLRNCFLNEIQAKFKTSLRNMELRNCKKLEILN